VFQRRRLACRRAGQIGQRCWLVPSPLRSAGWLDVTVSGSRGRKKRADERLPADEHHVRGDLKPMVVAYMNAETWTDRHFTKEVNMGEACVAPAPV